MIRSMTAPRPRTELTVERAQRLGHRTALALIGILLLCIVALLPFAVGDALGEILDPQGERLYFLTPPDVPPAATHTRLHLDILAIDQWQRAVSVRVAGSHICLAACDWNVRYLVVAAPERGAALEGLPPSQALTFPPDGRELTQTITLPVVGDPIRYPFERYRLRLGVILQRVYPGGRVETLTPEAARGHAYLTLHADLPQMDASVATDRTAVALGLAAPPYEYVAAAEVTFASALYLRVLMVGLVLLAAATAGYAALLRPFNDLLVNAGALILGIWGIRSILLGSAPPGLSAIDLSLSLIILGLLLIITVRMLLFHRDRAEIVWRRPPPPAHDLGAADGLTPTEPTTPPRRPRSNTKL